MCLDWNRLRSLASPMGTSNRPEEKVFSVSLSFFLSHFPSVKDIITFRLAGSRMI